MCRCVACNNLTSSYTETLCSTCLRSSRISKYLASEGFTGEEEKEYAHQGTTSNISGSQQEEALTLLSVYEQ